jgi:hypothetical protein
VDGETDPQLIVKHVPMGSPFQSHDSALLRGPLLGDRGGASRSFCSHTAHHWVCPSSTKRTKGGKAPHSKILSRPWIRKPAHSSNPAHFPQGRARKIASMPSLVPEALDRRGLAEFVNTKASSSVCVCSGVGGTPCITHCLRLHEV